jgi:thiosulfate/3-mercaptopyruvate sulfurtransferase
MLSPILITKSILFNIGAKTSRVMLHSMKMSSSVHDNIPTLISSKEAIGYFNSGKFKFLDGSWHLNKKDRNAKEEYLTQRIPNSYFVDIDEICDKTVDLPHMMPSANGFSMYMSKIGISSDDKLIIYVNKGCFSAPRVWWMFKAFGHKSVSIIDGGLPAWIDANGPIESGPLSTSTSLSKYVVPEGTSQMKCSWNDVLQIVDNGSAQILDARSKARFTCQAPEPRAGLTRGHIPGSLNLPFNELLEQNNWTKFKSKEEIRQAFEDAGIILGSKVITTCGSGVSAAVLTLGLHILGYDLTMCPIYDGSWAEWGGRDDLPKTTFEYKE